MSTADFLGNKLGPSFELRVRGVPEEFKAAPKPVKEIPRYVERAFNFKRSWRERFPTSAKARIKKLNETLTNPPTLTDHSQEPTDSCAPLSPDSQEVWSQLVADETKMPSGSGQAPLHVAGNPYISESGASTHTGGYTVPCHLKGIDMMNRPVAPHRTAHAHPPTFRFFKRQEYPTGSKLSRTKSRAHRQGHLKTTRVIGGAQDTLYRPTSVRTHRLQNTQKVRRLQQHQGSPHKGEW